MKLLSLTMFCLPLALGQIIDPQKHDIFTVTAATFTSVIGKHRNDGAAAVLYFDGSKHDEAKKYINGFYGNVASTMKGQVRIAGCDCSSNEEFCTKQGVKNTPMIMIYPTNPVPPFAYEGAMKQTALINTLSRLIPTGNVKSFQSVAEVNSFLRDNSLPNILMFSKKAVVPPLYNSLANAFSGSKGCATNAACMSSDRLAFGFVGVPSEDVMKSFKVNKLPALMAYKNGQVEKFEGQMTFQTMFDWLNLRSETFGRGGGYAEEGIETTKPWLAQKYPEMNSASHNDICFKHKALCIILLTDGDLGDHAQMLDDLSAIFGAGASGPNFRWMWMDMEKETEWKEALGVQTLPSLCAFQAGKQRLRYMLLDQKKVATFEHAKGMIDAVMGGDGKFKNIKKLPKFKSSTQNKEEL